MRPIFTVDVITRDLPFVHTLVVVGYNDTDLDWHLLDDFLLVDVAGTHAIVRVQRQLIRLWSRGIVPIMGPDTAAAIAHLEDI